MGVEQPSRTCCSRDWKDKRDKEELDMDLYSISFISTSRRGDSSEDSLLVFSGSKSSFSWIIMELRTVPVTKCGGSRSNGKEGS